MLQGASSHLGHGAGEAGVAPLGRHQAMAPEGFRTAGNGPQVMGIGDAINRHQQGRFRALVTAGQQVLQGDAAGGGGLQHDALMHCAATELRQTGPTHLLHHHARGLGLPQHLHESGAEPQFSGTPHAVNGALTMEHSLSGVTAPHQVPRGRHGLHQGKRSARGRVMVRRWRSLWMVMARPAVPSTVLPLPRSPSPTGGPPLTIRLPVPAGTGTTAMATPDLIGTPPPGPFPGPILAAAFAVPGRPLVPLPPGAPLSRPWTGGTFLSPLLGSSLGTTKRRTTKRSRWRHGSELGRSMVNPPGLLATPLHEPDEAGEVMISVMGTGASLRVILDPEDGPPL